MLAAVQAGTKVPDVTVSVQALAGRLAELLESKARAFAPMEPRVPPVTTEGLTAEGAGGAGEPQVPPVDGQLLGAQSMGTGKGQRGRAFSRSRSPVDGEVVQSR